MNVFQAPGNRAEKFIDAVNAASLPDPSTLNNGDYYIIQTGGTLWGKTWANGDRAVSDGTAYSQDVDATKQVAEGGTGATTAAGARVNLDTFSRSEIISALGTRLQKPSLYFNGNSAYLEVPDDTKFSFLDGSGDRVFAVRLRFKADDITNAYLIAKGTTGSIREWGMQLRSGGEIRFVLRDESVPVEIHATTNGAGIVAGRWYNVLITLNPVSVSASRADDIGIYIDGKPQSGLVVSNQATYVSMENTSGPVLVGAAAATYFKGHISDWHVLNLLPSASEVDLLSKDGDIPFGHQWAGAFSGIYASNFAGDSVDNWTASQGVIDATATVGGDANNIQLTLNNATGSHYFSSNTAFTIGAGKLCEVEIEVFVHSTNTNADGFALYWDGSLFIGKDEAPTLDTWTKYRFQTTSRQTGLNRLYLIATDGGALTVTDPGGDDKIAIREVKITELGVISDGRAERFDPDTGKLHCASNNAFVYVNNNAAIVGVKTPVYKTGIFTPGLTFGGGNTGMVISASEGFLTRDGNLCHIEGMITLSAKGTSTGSAVITGLEFLGPNLSGNNIPVTFGRCANMANLTSPIIGNIVDNSNTIALQDVGAAGSVDLDETNFTDTTVITFSATYRIQ